MLGSKEFTARYARDAENAKALISHGPTRTYTDEFIAAFGLRAVFWTRIDADEHGYCKG
jgi:hypothetical protein